MPEGLPEENLVRCHWVLISGVQRGQRDLPSADDEGRATLVHPRIPRDWPWCSIRNTSTSKDSGLDSTTPVVGGLR